MIQSPAGLLRLILLSSGIMAGCSKSITHSDSTSSAGTDNDPIIYFTTDPAKSPYYGDSILYVTGPGRSAYLHSPLNALGEGKYIAWPKGLTIDERTGVIDILQSEPGARYNIGFVNARTKDTAYNQVILAGVSYPDGLYYMDSRDSVLLPYYNEAGVAPWTSAISELQGKGLSGDNGRFDDAPAGQGANDQQLFVNKASGTINLHKSVREGLFGKNPGNGHSRQISIYYRLNDNSAMSLQKTTLTLYYYDALRDVPGDLLNAVNSHQNAFLQSQNSNAGTGSIESTGLSPAGLAPVIKKAVMPRSVPAPAPPRPPQIVIVNKGHP